MVYGWQGGGMVMTLIVSLLGIAVFAAVIYLAVRLAVQHALKSHTRWLHRGSALFPTPLPGTRPPDAGPPAPGTSGPGAPPDASSPGPLADPRG